MPYWLRGDYFSDGIITDGTLEPGKIILQEGKGFDFQVIDILTDKIFFKPIRMTEWFDLSRQGIYNALEKNRQNGVKSGPERS